MKTRYFFVENVVHFKKNTPTSHFTDDLNLSLSNSSLEQKITIIDTLCAEVFEYETSKPHAFETAQLDWAMVRFEVELMNLLCPIDIEKTIPKDFEVVPQQMVFSHNPNPSDTEKLVRFMLHKCFDYEDEAHLRDEFLKTSNDKFLAKRLYNNFLEYPQICSVSDLNKILIDYCSPLVKYEEMLTITHRNRNDNLNTSGGTRETCLLYLVYHYQNEILECLNNGKNLSLLIYEKNQNFYELRKFLVIFNRYGVPLTKEDIKDIELKESDKKSLYIEIKYDEKIKQDLSKDIAKRKWIEKDLREEVMPFDNLYLEFKENFIDTTSKVLERLKEMKLWQYRRCK
ncbi:hypothetical protein [Helicobacter cetorum]|uniref:Uncharacterized protein n=1 Tax=Helicobacter cetorum (strain ATCC BAA-429 / MIT 00-7128) TaxID=182217 RepID=I0EME1_HELC0|nr:hypothetical protein [Helicobacter cetorum]AFI04110.1 hypothetical protein HCW_04205 [Helicobacter cetorum MIT 00-7128]